MKTVGTALAAASIVLAAGSLLGAVATDSPLLPGLISRRLAAVAPFLALAAVLLLGAARQRQGQPR
jgi:hypothetical protein